MFVAIDELDIGVGNDGVQPGELDPALALRYTIEAELSDGRTVELPSPGG